MARSLGLARVRLQGRAGVAMPADSAAGPVIPSNPTAIGGGALIWLRSAGITEASGVVASWDSEGSNTQRFSSPTTPARPTVVTTGSLTGAQYLGTDDRSVADATITWLRPYTWGMVFSVQEFPATPGYVWDGDPRARVNVQTATGTPKLQWIDNLVNLETGALVTNTIYSVIGRAAASADSRLYLDGTSVATGSPGTRVMTPTAWSIGSLQAGSQFSKVTIYDFEVYGSTYLSDANITLLNDWHTYVKSLLV